MDKLKGYLLFSIFVFMFCIVSVNADSFPGMYDIDDIPNESYVIGEHLFTREKNDNYDGTLTTQLIMLAAKTIWSDDINDLIIYYKTSSGKWIDGLSGKAIEEPWGFISYINTRMLFSGLDSYRNDDILAGLGDVTYNSIYTKKTYGLTVQSYMDFNTIIGIEVWYTEDEDAVWNDSSNHGGYTKLDYDEDFVRWYSSYDDEEYEYFDSADLLLDVPKGKTYYYIVRFYKRYSAGDTGVSYSKFSSPVEFTNDQIELYVSNYTFDKDGNKILSFNIDGLNDGYDGVELYYSTSEHGTYNTLGVFNVFDEEDCVSLEVIKATLSKNQTYYYKVKPFIGTDSKQYGLDSTIVKVENKENDILGKRLKSVNYETQDVISEYVYELSYKNFEFEDSDYDGAEVYYSTSKNGAYTKLTEINSALGLVDVTVPAGQTYYYYVKLFTGSGAGKTYGLQSNIVECGTSIEKPNINYIYDEYKKFVKKLEFNNYDADINTGYEIYRSSSSNGKYTLYDSKDYYEGDIMFKSPKYTSYIKIRYYSKVDGNKIYGPFSDVEKIEGYGQEFSFYFELNKMYADGTRTYYVNLSSEGAYSGYELYKSSTNDGSYSLVGEYNWNDEIITIEDQNSAYYKIRTFIKYDDGSKEYSDYSEGDYIESCEDILELESYAISSVDFELSLFYDRDTLIGDLVIEKSTDQTTWSEVARYSDYDYIEEEVEIDSNSFIYYRAKLVNSEGDELVGKVIKVSNIVETPVLKGALVDVRHSIVTFDYEGDLSDIMEVYVYGSNSENGEYEYLDTIYPSNTGELEYDCYDDYAYYKIAFVNMQHIPGELSNAVKVKLFLDTSYYTGKLDIYASETETGEYVLVDSLIADFYDSYEELIQDLDIDAKYKFIKVKNVDNYGGVEVSSDFSEPVSLD